MLPLSNSSLCKSRRHCVVCRDQSQTSWRLSLTAVYSVPGAPDFNCPFGLPWGFDGDGRLAGDSPDGKLRGAGDVIAGAAKAIGIKPCGGCLKRQEELNRLSQAAARAVGAVVKTIIGANE
jgi:hypothetical protein